MDLQLDQMQEIKERCRRAEEALKALQERNRLLGNSAPFGIFTVDVQGRITGMNQRIRDMLPPQGETNPNLINIFEFPALVESGVSEDIRRCLETREPITADHPCTTPQEDCVHLRYHLSPVPDTEGSVSGVMAFVEDFTKLKLAQEALEENEQRYRIIFRCAPIAMIERDASGLKTYLKQLHLSGHANLRDYLQANPEEVLHCMGLIKTVDYNDAFLELVQARDRQEFLSGFDPMAVLGTENHWMAQEFVLLVAQGNIQRERELTIITLKGNRKRVIVRSLVIAGHEDTFSRVVNSLVDITKRMEAEEALRASEQRCREQSLQDNLTGLYNTRYLYQSLSGLIETAAKAESRLSILFMDLDNFKHVVDTHGHLNGSRVIQEVAVTIRDVLSPPAYAVAYAGDEFVVVLPGVDQPQAVEKASEIQSKIRAATYLSNQGKRVQVQASCGIATFPTHASDLTSLLAAADNALFAVKRKDKGAIGLSQDLALRLERMERVR